MNPANLTCPYHLSKPEGRRDAISQRDDISAVFGIPKTEEIFCVCKERWRINLYEFMMVSGSVPNQILQVFRKFF